MTKFIIYVFLFALILGGVGFAFFSVTTPNVPQQTITRTLDPKDAFTMPAPTPIAAPTPAPTQVPPAGEGE